jgi:hypothetical protein
MLKIHSMLKTKSKKRCIHAKCRIKFFKKTLTIELLIVTGCFFYIWRDYKYIAPSKL